VAVFLRDKSHAPELPLVVRAKHTSLIERRFSHREIYPPELGCADDGQSGMCGTPLDGTTLLHLAIDFDEQEIFDLLLAHGADVNAGATVDAAGFGGHTPLFTQS
jgi:ankyrin repeat protein